MSSYGRINGVPSSASFITDWAASLDKYAVGSGTDAGADTPYTDNTTAEPGMSPANVYGEWGNGYDTVYAPNDAYKAAFMAAAGHKVSADAEVLTAAIDNNLNGITTDNLLNAAESYITIRTRTGIYDEKDENGLSKYSDFWVQCKGKYQISHLPHPWNKSQTKSPCQVYQRENHRHFSIFLLTDLSTP